MGTHAAPKWGQSGEDLGRLVAVRTQLVLFLWNCDVVLFRMTCLSHVSCRVQWEMPVDSNPCCFLLVLP